MKTLHRTKQYFWLSVILLSTMSLLIPVVPATIQNETEETVWSTVVAVVFWLLAAAGCWAIISANAHRKQYVTEKFGKHTPPTFPPGAFCFFSNPLATVADLSVIVTGIGFVVAVNTPLQDTYFAVVLLSLFIWAVLMHCLFNSRTFRVIQKKTKERK